MKNLLLFCLALPLCALADESHCPKDIKELYDKSNAVVLLESLTNRVDYEEFKSSLLSLGEGKKDEAALLDEWESNYYFNDRHMFLVRRSYKNEGVGEKIAVDFSGFSKLYFKVGDLMILFLDKGKLNSFYDLNYCMVVDLERDNLLSLGIVKDVGSENVKLLISGLEGAAASDRNRTKYLKLFKTTQMIVAPGK